jgi:hypothetical protein
LHDSLLEQGVNIFPERFFGDESCFVLHNEHCIQYSQGRQGRHAVLQR